jgi:molecular chaperone GrpE
VSTAADGGGTEPAGAASEPGVMPEPVLRSASPADQLDPYGVLETALTERRTLVELCLYALDRARSTAVAARIEQTLAGIGVTAVRPDGEPFDPSRHEAGGTVPTDDPGLAGVVAETEVAGFADRGRPLRAPVVLVYQRRLPTARGPQ